MGQSNDIRRDWCSWFVHSASPTGPDVDVTSGFDYDFNSIEDDTNELFCAYREMFELAISQQTSPMRHLLGIYFPIINVLFVSEYHQMAGVLHPHWR